MLNLSYVDDIPPEGPALVWAVRLSSGTFTVMMAEPITVLLMVMFLPIYLELFQVLWYFPMHWNISHNMFKPRLF